MSILYEIVHNNIYNINNSIDNVQVNAKIDP